MKLYKLKITTTQGQSEVYAAVTNFFQMEEYLNKLKGEDVQIDEVILIAMDENFLILVP
jgi:hypothetical protein